MFIGTFRELQPPLHPPSVLRNVARFSKVLFSLTMLIPFLPSFFFLYFSFCCTHECLILAGKQSSKASYWLCMFSLWLRALKMLQGPNESCFCVSPSSHMDFHHTLELVILSEFLRLWKREGCCWLWGAICCVHYAKCIHPTLLPASEPFATRLLMVVWPVCCMLIYLCQQWYSYTKLMWCITVSEVEFPSIKLLRSPHWKIERTTSLISNKSIIFSLINP